MNCSKTNDLELLSSLKPKKKDGSLDSEESLNSQALKWRNLIDYKTLENWLICQNEEIRLQTLELLTISKKSTLAFSSQEFDLIIFFLKFNTREKIEYVPLIKKVIKRVNDSYAVVKRQLDKENRFKELQKLHPNSASLPEISSITESQVRSYKKFVTSLHQICLENLYPSAVNVRKKSSLQILCLMDEFLSIELKSSLWELDQFKHLFDCLLLDTYQINKDMAFRLIRSSGLVESYFNSEKLVLELISVATELANSIRPLDSITAAYMLKISMLIPNIQDILLNFINIDNTIDVQEKTSFYVLVLLKTCLEKPVNLATENIVIASSKHSLYGYVYCIHSILTTVNLKNIIDDDCWRKAICDIVNMCFELNSAVSQIVNSSSPEGHLPMDFDPKHLDSIFQNSEDFVITPQMVLLCSWRTVKEISLFFGYLTLNAPIFDEKKKIGILSQNQFQEIGNTLFTMLCETKHRGAFEQAHVGFGQLCSRLWHLGDEEKFLKQLPKLWLQQILLAVVGLTSENSKLCATRRSAGVPFMVQALVTSEIKKRSDPQTLVFHSVMRILLKLINIENTFTVSDAKELLFSESLFNDLGKNQLSIISNEDEEKSEKLNEITEIKTHSLNIIRALFRHCLLGDLVKEYIADGFIAAFKNYEGTSWAERNAATLLFSSLVVRVFGVQRTKDHVNLTLHNRMTGNNFFEKFPSLLPFLLNELKIFVHETEDQIKPKIQSILLILSRLYPGVSCENAEQEWKIHEFIDLVSKCGKSKVYKTRELAARALIPLLTKNNVLSIFSHLLSSMTSENVSLNLLHGYTLQLLELVKSDQFTLVDPPCDEFKVFLTFFTTNFLSCLESSNNRPACFPVASGVLEIIRSLSVTNFSRWIYQDSEFLALLEKIQLHLTSKGILKKRPGVELYEVAAMDLIISTVHSDSYFGHLKNNEYISAQFWEKIFGHENTELLKIVWSKIISVIQKTDSTILYDLSFMTAIARIDPQSNDPYLQEAVYEFFFDAVKEIEKDSEYIQYTFSREEEKSLMCMHIFSKLHEQLKSKTFYPRAEFFKLFGKVFGFLMKRPKDVSLSDKLKKDVYEAFLNYSVMEVNLDCRIAISEILFDLFIKDTKKDHINYTLNWWTTLLQLLYDDNFQVRSNAAEIVFELSPESRFKCEEVVINAFFSKFVSNVKDIEAVVAAFFCWSMTSADIVLEEMDDSEVFNKSTNYECFEPLQITDKCIARLKEIIPKLNPNTIMTKPIKEWVKKQLNLDETINFETLEELILNYKVTIPSSEESLKRILDPIYPVRVIKEMSYWKIRETAVARKSERDVTVVVGGELESKG